MDLYTLSFTYPRSELGVEGGTTVEAVHALCVQTMATVPSSVTYAQADDGRSFHWHVSGGYSNVMAARAFILRECPVATRSSIPVPRSEILDISNPNAPTLNVKVRSGLDDIASSTLAHIAVVNTSTAATASTTSLERETPCHLVVTGPSDTVSLAQVRLLVMLDELSTLHAESIDIDCKLHPIIAGRKRLRVQHIQEETATNIYFPYPLRGMVGGPPAPNPNAKNTIYITGEFFGVQRAKDMLFQVARNKSHVVISRETAIQPRKLDWLLTDRLDDLKQIMSDTATYLDVPSLGSGIINVFGDSRQNIQKAIKAVMLLTTQYIQAQFYLLPTHFNLLLPPPTALLMTNPAQITPMLKHLTALTGQNGMNGGSGGGGADIVFRENVFEFFGGIDECRRGIVGVADLAIAKSYHHEIRFALELAQEHREFISGKKNGKINKIMQLTGCKIRFEGIGGDNNIQPLSPSSNSAMSPTTPTTTTATSPTFTTFSSMVQGNFTITLSAQTLPSALDGLTLLLDEMPSEISFHVPEAYHKRIIGVGGRSVQRIMKKWGVFVKFFNSEGVDENGDGVGNGSGGGGGGGGGNHGVMGLIDNGSGGDVGGDGVSTTSGVGEGEDNVVARTPAKNAMNLENLKMNVLELVNPKVRSFSLTHTIDKDFTIETVAIPRRYHRILMSEKSIFIRDIESKTGSKVRFPDRELASDIVTILGPETQVHIAAARLLDHVPFEAELTLPVPLSQSSSSTNGVNSTRSSPRSHRSTSSSPDITLLCASPDFAAFVERVKREYGVVLTYAPTANPLHDSAPSVKFKFRCQKSTSDMVPAVREALEAWLVSKGVSVYAGSGNGGIGSGIVLNGIGGGHSVPVVKPHHAQSLPQPATQQQQQQQQHVHKRADSFADAFPHFNSKLLSGAGGSQDGGSLNRRIRMATSSPDVKALFNRHSSTHSLHQQATKQVYNLPEHDEQDDEGFEAPTVPESPGEYYVPRIRHAPSISFIPRMSSTIDTYGGSNASSVEESFNSLAGPPSTLTSSAGAVSADGKIRSLTNRAQSLDLTSLNRKGGPIVTSSRDSVRIPSPVDSSPPNSATAIVHSFPSVYGPPPATGHGTGYTSNNGIYTHQNHHSYSSAMPYGYQYQPNQNQFNYSSTTSVGGTRPRTTQVSSLSLSSSSSSLSLKGDIEVDDVSRVLEQIRLDGLH
ncbi:hypothetical protein FRB96_002026 [Tulasnella sp. 330]|nr:hypothetical protein FRB96_002026 [Tulasnella sp. 330]KAG8877114.1 hypothetical protein FRB97_003678 [Tulasnella sp. 331]